MSTLLYGSKTWTVAAVTGGNDWYSKQESTEYYRSQSQYMRQIQECGEEIKVAFDKKYRWFADDCNEPKLRVV